MGDKAEFRAGGKQRTPGGPEVRVHPDSAQSSRPRASAADIVASLMADASRQRSVSAVSRDLGHEIKSVLNVVALNLALLSRVASTGQPTRADLELAARSGDVMRRELKRLDNYIDGILRAHGRDDEGWQRVDLSACCQRVGLLIAARAARQRVTVRLSVPDAEVFIEACPAQLQNALLNLAVNSLDAMPNGGTLDLQVSADGPTARFRIIDSGPGLSDEVRSDPWEPRQTVDGPGVGLAVVKAAIDAHDGRIVYHRASGGQGACFTAEFTRLTVR
ncbi:MAG TPA: HAMP domain-containing sensor histidine kinase [Vicinamibacterales bacterium]|jgi:signal transduction histidine kinase|nr:HAMP domain-containing sensor histidine kinase [Vicinamibacterales bacterium]